MSRNVTDLIVKEAKQSQYYTWVIINEAPEEKLGGRQTYTPRTQSQTDGGEEVNVYSRGATGKGCKVLLRPA